MMQLSRVVLGLCVAVSVRSQTESSDVRLPPTIIQGPIKLVNQYRPDNSFNLECIAYGIPEAITYEWKKNGEVLNLNAANIEHGVGGTITVKEASLKDEGYYQCFAKNQYGIAISNTSFQQKGVLDFKGNQNVLTKTVNEGEPFHIQAQTFKSIPKATFRWNKALDAVDKNPILLSLSSRLQIADNGDLYFAYAIADDDLGGKIYKCEAYNAILDFTSGGSYTAIKVTRVPGGPPKFAPIAGFLSDKQLVAVEGDELDMRCFFSGNPVPVNEWSGPGNTLPLGRFAIESSGTKLTILNVQPSDEGDYTCSAKNDMGMNRTKFTVRVEAKPTFLRKTDRPYDTNITAGESITFNCSAYAKPVADVVWFRNGQQIDVSNPPKRFVISTDKKSLTIRNLCRDCDDRPESSQSDLGIIQCNASNVHGYAFAAGYVNVLRQTKVVLNGDKEVSVDMNEEKDIKFECTAVSDPITPVVPRWYKVETEGDQVVFEVLPVLTLKGGELSIHVVPNKTEPWAKYQGSYKCFASNGYSNSTEIAQIKVTRYVDPGPPVASVYWWVILLILLILLLIIIILCCCICLRRNRGDKYDVDEKERKNGNDPEKELKTNDFQDYQRPEAQTLKGSRGGSLGSAGKLNSDDEASLLEYGDDPGKFTEDGSFVGAYATNTADRSKGRKE